MSNDTGTLITDTNYQKIIADFQSQLGTLPSKPASTNKKLSESRLRLAAIQALPTVVVAEVSLEEALRGAVRSFTVYDQIACANCINAKPVNRLQCNECKGLGYKKVERAVEITLSPGLIPDAEIRHAELGAFDFRSGKNGDLVIKISINEHPLLKLEGNNITYKLSVSLYEAILGSDVEVQTATGKMLMHLQPMTQSGSVYRLKGLGLAGADQLVSIQVNMPQKLNSEQIQLFRRIAEIARENAARNTLAFTA